MIRLRVKEVAKEKGVSMSLLGRLANVDTRTMRRVYRNPTGSFTTPTIDRLAKALGVDAKELIETIPDTDE